MLLHGSGGSPASKLSGCGPNGGPGCCG
jgi:hypothetical protein